jgi:hypothetical protein
MELESLKRLAYWICFFVIMLFMAVFMIADRLPWMFRAILVLLFAFLSAWFRLEQRYSFLSLVVVFISGLAIGTVMANNTPQMWSFAFMYVILFFLSCEVFERRLLGI